MLSARFSETKSIWIDLHQQINYWKTQHARAVERETQWKKEAQELEKTVKCQCLKISDFIKQVEELKAQIVWLKQRLFGQKTEQSKPLENNTTPDSIEDDSSSETSSEEKRPRGKQEGTKGYGRKSRTNLPSVEILHDLKEDEKRCPICGLPFKSCSLTEDSEEIHYEVRPARRVHKRKCYSPACSCGSVPNIVIAPLPPKLIPKGMFSIDFWAHILSEKFLFQRPMSRILNTLALEGLDVSQGTITGGLQKIKEMVYPLYTKILERSRNAEHWHMDETRWMMFVTINGKTGYRWWLWVVATKDTVVYILDPSRSASVPKNLLGENPKGIISADRYSVYKSLRSENLVIAFCWGHVRRDYIEIFDARKKLQPWAQDWINRINEIFALNDKRLQVLKDHNKFYLADQELRSALNSMQQVFENELKDVNLSSVQHKALNSLQEHWSGLLIFVDYPEIPMDNNLSERSLREAALGRKNYYGCSSLWSGDLTAALFTIFQTAHLNHLHPKKFLRAYLEACARNHGKAPDDIDNFLPWNMSESFKSGLEYKRPPP